MKKNFTRVILSMLLAMIFCLSLASCGGAGSGANPDENIENAEESDSENGAESNPDTPVYQIGLCNYVDDASLNQIVDNIQARLSEIGAENGVEFRVRYDNCNADAAVLSQIIANFIADGVDLMIGVATPVAIAMQAATEENQIPVVFSAVSDPEGAELVRSNQTPGANITGTSDYLNTNAMMNLIFAANPDASKIGLLYDQGQDSSTAPIADAKAYLKNKGVEIVERAGTSTDEVMLAAQALVSDGVDAVFTPTDNTIMTAELSIYEIFSTAGIPHYAGADSFALNGAFVGYGVDYANLGRETADMAADLLLNNANPAETPVRTFDNGTATVNIEICEQLGLDLNYIKSAFAPHCTNIVEITTAESFDDLG